MQALVTLNKQLELKGVDTLPKSIPAPTQDNSEEMRKLKNDLDALYRKLAEIERLL